MDKWEHGPRVGPLFGKRDHFNLHCSSFTYQSASNRLRWQKFSYGQVTSKCYQKCCFIILPSTKVLNLPCGTLWSVFSNICPVHMAFWMKNGLNWPKFKLDASLRFSKINNTLASYLRGYSSLLELSKSDWFRWQKSSYGQITSKWHQHAFFIISLSTVVLSGCL